ncbi:MAG: DUF3098 domain-containing protein [Bacteroidales bacterium]|nr:DUF3098 domain-containing protein [Bacteroidales bacterium]MCF8386258.1 DUF3098 domain-containing protein [Bacteroidales bacterium]MCF8397511.1 DUF3098 domain-containing protein [Bacteroidales bacterium]
MAKTSTAKDKPANPKQKEKILPEGKTFAFKRENYKLMFIGLGLIVIGFLLMIGGGSDDPDVFSYELFSFRRMTLAPILIMAGYVVEIFAIMKRPKED